MTLAALAVLAALAAGVTWKAEHRPPPALSPMSAPAADPAVEAADAEALHQQRAGEIAQVREAVRAGNVPIIFWGRVVNAEGKPLAGATVRYTVRGGYEAFGLAWSRFTSHAARTDADGRFEISGWHGDQLEIEAVEKPGYRAAPGQPRLFTYASQDEDPFQPDALEPVPFILLGDYPAAEASPSGLPTK